MDESLRKLRTKYRFNLRGLGALVGLVAFCAFLARVYSPNVGAAVFIVFMLVMLVIVVARPRDQDLEGMGGPSGFG